MKPIEAIKEILKNILISTALIAIIKNTSLEATIQNQPQNSYLRAKIKMKYKHIEIVKDWNQGGCGIGVIFA